MRASNNRQRDAAAKCPGFPIIAKLRNDLTAFYLDSGTGTGFGTGA